MRLNILNLVITILLGICLTLWLDQDSAAPTESVSQPAAPESKNLSEGIVPSFSFSDLEGKKFRIEDFRGKTVVLNFWASWCAPCVIEFPKLVQLAKDRDDLVLIALSSDIDNQKIENFLKKYPASAKNMIVARDEKRQITGDIFGTYKLPETIIVSPDGFIARKIVGDTDWNSPEFSKFFDSLKDN